MPCPPPGELPDPGIEPASPVLQADSFPLSYWGSTPLQESTLTFFKQRFCHTPHIRSQYTAEVLATWTSKSCKTHRKVFFHFQPAGGPPPGGGFRGDSIHLSWLLGPLWVGPAVLTPCAAPGFLSSLPAHILQSFSLPPQCSVGHSDTVSSLLYPLGTEFVPGQFCRRP